MNDDDHDRDHLDRALRDARAAGSTTPFKAMHPVGQVLVVLICAAVGLLILAGVAWAAKLAWWVLTVWTPGR